MENFTQVGFGPVFLYRAPTEGRSSSTSFHLRMLLLSIGAVGKPVVPPC